MLSQKTGNDYITYLYDENGTAYAIIHNDSYYYYVFNAQGDVIKLLDNSGNIVVQYEYNSWGKILSITNGNGEDVSNIPTNIGNINPLRYRGYYYDNETGLYYLNSRYYDPEVGRFINADGLITSGQGILDYNMFAYCGNNPVNREDPSGMGWYDSNGNWRHDNWEYIPCYDGTVLGYQPDPNAPEKKQSSKKTPSKASSSGVKFIADYEGGFRSTPYDDGYGNPTIGYGHLITENEVFVSITEAQALQLLSNDLSRFEEKVTTYSDSIGIIWDQNQYDAFVDLAFNSGNRFKDVMDSIALGSDPYLAFSQVIYASGQKSLGLYRRRMDEADMFCNGTYNRTYRGW